MKKFTNSTVKAKLVILIAMNTFFIALGGIIVYWQSNKIVRANKDLQKNLEAIICQGQLDIMHDAIRGDVYSALLPNTEANTAMSQLQEHGTIGSQKLDEMISPTSLPDVRSGYTKTAPVYKQYVQAAEKIIETAKTDKNAALAGVAEFETAYIALEGELGKMGDIISAISVKDNQILQGLASELLILLIIGVVVAIIVNLVMGWIIERLISPRIAELTIATEKVLLGDYSHNVPETHDDDIGTLIKAFNVMKTDIKNRLHGAKLMMNTIVEMTSDQRSTETALESMLKGLMEIVKARYAAASIMNEDGSVKSFVTVGMTEEQKKRIAHPPVGKGLLGHIQQTGKVLRVADMSKHPSSSGFPSGHPPMKSFVGAPILFGKESMGNVYFTEKEDGKEFTDFDEDTIPIVSQLAGIVITDRKTKHDLRAIVGQIQELSYTMADSTQSISGATEELAAGAREQSGQAIDVAAAVEEMASNIIETANSAQKTSEFAQSNGQLATEGQQTVQNTIAKMRHIAGVVHESQQTVQRLGDAGTSIVEIVSVISDIADQTNLLALNAAIEAARAGDQGRGFAVVADEVRKLAERTTTATKQIRDMITSIQKETSEAVKQMQQGSKEVEQGIAMADNAGEALKQVVQSAGHMVELVSSIAGAAQEQSLTSDTIARNVTNISTISAESASTIMDVARNVTELSQLAEILKELTSQVDVTGRRKKAELDSRQVINQRKTAGLLR
ncbi:MAG: GAF domain-containing protein [Ignavibacteria bacterium]|nr:GAF domain-containing protein [Ignavibacteria bacterium]